MVGSTYETTPEAGGANLQHYEMLAPDVAGWLLAS